MTVDAEAGRKGATTKLLGVCLLFVGALDSMLSWRGGFALSNFYLVLLGAGAGLYAIGAIRAAHQTPTPRATGPDA